MDLANLDSDPDSVAMKLKQNKFRSDGKTSLLAKVAFKVPNS
jgi:hypothetical protein